MYKRQGERVPLWKRLLNFSTYFSSHSPNQLITPDNNQVIDWAEHNRPNLIKVSVRNATGGWYSSIVITPWWTSQSESTRSNPVHSASTSIRIAATSESGIGIGTGTSTGAGSGPVGDQGHMAFACKFIQASGDNTLHSSKLFIYGCNSLQQSGYVRMEYI